MNKIFLILLFLQGSAHTRSCKIQPALPFVLHIQDRPSLALYGKIQLGSSICNASFFATVYFHSIFVVQNKFSLLSFFFQAMITFDHIRFSLFLHMLSTFRTNLLWHITKKFNWTHQQLKRLLLLTQ